MGLPSCLAWLQVGVSFPLHRCHLGVAPVASEGDPSLKLVQMTLASVPSVSLHPCQQGDAFSESSFYTYWNHTFFWLCPAHLGCIVGPKSLELPRRTFHSLGIQLTGASHCHTPARCTELFSAAIINLSWVSPCWEGEKGKMQRGITFN